MTGYERAVEYARKHDSRALWCALVEEGYEGDGVDYNKLVDGWEKEESTPPSRPSTHPYTQTDTISDPRS